jgi:hypothetical protein
MLQNHGKNNEADNITVPETEDKRRSQSPQLLN